MGSKVLSLIIELKAIFPGDKLINKVELKVGWNNVITVKLSLHTGLDQISSSQYHIGRPLTKYYLLRSWFDFKIHDDFDPSSTAWNVHN